LRETARLREAAAALRQAQKGIDSASAHWPELRAGLQKSARLMRATQVQVKSALARREEYEAAIEQTVELTSQFAATLPELVEQMEEGLAQQEQSLDELADSIDEVTGSVPPAARSASQILATTRWLLCLVAFMVGLHAAYLAGSTAWSWRKP
jgi:chromosome segregation ATPase